MLYPYFSDNTLHPSEANRYAKQLNGLWEPALPHETTDLDLDVFRFLYLRSFHRPIVIRAELSGWPQIVCKMGDGYERYDPGELIRNERFRLTAAEAGYIRQAIEATDFWNAPTHDPTAGVGIDGAQWVFEGVRNGRYRVISRHSPPGEEWRRLCEVMLEQARLVGRIY